MAWFRKITVPFSNETKEIDVPQTWVVRWQGRVGPYYSDLIPECEVFISEKEALDFRESLEQAMKLLRYSGPGTKVTIEARTENG